MESAQAPLKQLKINMVVYTKVIRTEKRHRSIWVSGVGKDAVFHDQDLGWYMLLEGSHEAISCGQNEPHFIEDDKIKITFEKVQA